METVVIRETRILNKVVTPKDCEESGCSNCLSNVEVGVCIYPEIWT